MNRFTDIPLSSSATSYQRMQYHHNQQQQQQQSPTPTTTPSGESLPFLAQQLQRMQAKNAAKAATITATSSTSNSPIPYIHQNSGEPRQLPDLVAPGRFDVICARGAAAANHVGNLRFRDIVRQKLPQYSAAKTKLEKSLIVTTIVDAVRDYTGPKGGFIKKGKDGVWFDVGDAMAREKIGQCIRDALHCQYKSSTKAKKQRRKQLAQLKTQDPPSSSSNKQEGQVQPPKQKAPKGDKPCIVQSDSKVRSNNNAIDDVDAFRRELFSSRRRSAAAGEQDDDGPSVNVKQEDSLLSMMSSFFPLEDAFAWNQTQPHHQNQSTNFMMMEPLQF